MFIRVEVPAVIKVRSGRIWMQGLQNPQTVLKSDSWPEVF